MGVQNDCMFLAWALWEVKIDNTGESVGLRGNTMSPDLDVILSLDCSQNLHIEMFFKQIYGFAAQI